MDEHTAIGNAHQAWDFVKKHGPAPELEHWFISTPLDAYRYAIHTRRAFPLGEPIILTRADYAVNYAVDVLHKRWPAAEQLISRKATTSSVYAIHFRCAFPEGELAMYADLNKDHLYHYVQMLDRKASSPVHMSTQDTISLLAGLHYFKHRRAEDTMNVQWRFAQSGLDYHQCATTIEAFGLNHARDIAGVRGFLAAQLHALEKPSIPHLHTGAAGVDFSA